MPGEELNTTLRFSADITDFKAAVQEANRYTKLANSEFKAAAAGMDSWSNSTDGLAAKLKQLATVQQAEERKLDVLKEAYRKVAQEQGENSAAAIDLATKINNQQAVVNKVAKEFKDYSKKLEEVEKAADGAEDDVKDLGDAAEAAGDKAAESAEGWSIVKDVIADMVSNAISWAVDSFKELMTAGSDALASLGAQTGATTGELERYNGVMNEIYRNNYGESFDDIADAMSNAVRMFGDLDDASLQNVTEQAITLRDVFDMDYTESMRAVNSLMDQFGISADEAFNLVAQGAQNGLNQNGDLLDVINEYSVQFKNAGYSADDMFNMLANGAEAGVWSVDKLGDAVKEFNIRASDGTVTQALKDYRTHLGLTNADVSRLSAAMAEGGAAGQAAYNEILAALMGVENGTARYQAGVAMFGTMWEDLGEDAVLSLMNTEGAISSATDAMSEMQNVKYDTLSSALSGLGRIIQSDLIQPIANTLAPVAKSLVEWCINNIGVVGPIIAGVAAAVGVLAGALAIQGVINAASAAFALLNATLLANPITLVVAALAALAAGIMYAWQNSEAFRNGVTAAWEAVKSGIGTAVEAIGGFIENLASWFSDLPGKISSAIAPVVANVTTWGSNVFDAARTKVAEIITSVTTWFSELPGKISNAISGAVGNITAWGSSVYDAARSKITETITSVVSWMQELPGKMYNAISGAVGKIVAWGSDLASSGAEAAKKLFNSVVDGIKGLPDKLLSIGGNLVEGLWNGINDKFGWLTGKISSFTSSVLDKIKGFFGVHSPSTETKWIGDMLIAGFDGALEDGKNTLAATARDVSDETLDALNEIDAAHDHVEEWGDTLADIGKNAVSNLRETVISELKELAGYFKDVGGEIAEGFKGELNEGLSSAGSGLFDKFKDKAQSIKETIANSESTSGISYTIQHVASAAQEIVKDVAETVVDAVSGSTSAILATTTGGGSISPSSIVNDAIGEIGYGGVGIEEKTSSSKKNSSVKTNSKNTGTTVVVNQTINSPKAVDATEVYRQTKNAATYAANVPKAGGVGRGTEQIR